MNKKQFWGLTVICVAAISMVISVMGFPDRVKAAGDQPDLGDAAKFGMCEDATPRMTKKCTPEVGNCLQYTEIGDDTIFVIGTCYSFTEPPISSSPVSLPNGTTSTSAKAIESRGWGRCDGGGTGDTCQECGMYYCVKVKFWIATGCPADETPVTYACGKTNVCDPI